jgi:hypothetical protein
MGDEDRARQLPQRVRGASPLGSPPAASVPSLVLSDELRQRMQAAVTAERSETPSSEHAQEQETTQAGEVTSPPVNGAEEKVIRAVAAGPGRPAAERPAAERPAAERSAAPPQPAPPARTSNAGIIVEDEITEWLGPAVGASYGAVKSGIPARSDADESADVEPAGRPWAWLALPVVAVLVIGSLAVVVVRHFTGSPGSSAASAAARQQAAARDQAAAWVAQQVSRDVTVSCDPVMCRTLAAYGFPSRDLSVLGPTSPDPVTAAVVVETAAVQGLFGSSLATAWAPAVLASFGSGPAAITVRVIAPHGAAAYQTALSSDQADRKSAGAGLLNDPQITVPARATEQLSEGMVDTRLLLALAALARRQPITIVGFGNSGPGASSGVPLRFVDLAQNDQAAHLSRVAYLRSVRAYLSTVNATFRPATMTTVVLADGKTVLRVEVTAPSPLGVFGTKGFS